VIVSLNSVFTAESIIFALKVDILLFSYL